MKTHTELQQELAEIFKDHPEARKYVFQYTEYVHLIDDIIDEPKDDERTLKAFSLSCQLRNNSFYLANIHTLGVVDFLVNNTYADSVLWEKSPEDWKRRASDTLRHCGLDMFFMVVAIIAGREKLRSISPYMREYSHLKHINDLFTYVNNQPA